MHESGFIDNSGNRLVVKEVCVGGVRARVCMCVRACVLACVRACLRACVHWVHDRVYMCMRVYVRLVEYVFFKHNQRTLLYSVWLLFKL